MVIKMEKSKKQFSKKYGHLLFIGPHIILFCVFTVIPLVYGIYIAFTKWNLIGTPEFVGLNNFYMILFDSDSTFFDQFWIGMKNTLQFVVMAVPLSLVVPFLISLGINARIKGKTFFQSVFYLPGLFSISAVGIIFAMLFNPQLGLVNALFNHDVMWLREQPYAWIAILVTSIWWGIGGNMVIYIAAIAGVDKGLYEAAAIDGAGSIGKFWYITIPSIRFQLLYTLVMTITASFNIFGQPLMLTNGGPNSSTKVLMMYIRELAFGKGESLAGLGSAMALLLGIVIMIVSLTQFKFLDFNKEG